jgi:glycosyltransferase involved in cell wall biosynthesis
MKKILFVYTKMIIGGSTTSLLAILNNLDYSRYDVDLLLYEKGGDLFHLIPKEVHVLVQGNKYLPGSMKLFFKRMTSLAYVKDYIKSRILSLKYKNPLIKQQIMSYQSAKFSRIPPEHYYTAISFLEFWPSIIVSRYINAERKITWLHIDYKGTCLVPSLDKMCFMKFNKIVLVSEGCLHNFVDVFPELMNKSIFIENIISAKMLIQLSKEPICDIDISDFNINMITVCRIVFTPKGLDRGVRAIYRLKEEGLADSLRWYIIGEGEDFDALSKMISRYKLEKSIILLGKKVNPFPYVSIMDLFFLPSLYEGKPIVITEAMILGIPSMVCEYKSAEKQIKNGIDGIIIDNNDEAIYKGLKDILLHPERLESLKKMIKTQSEYGDINRIYEIIDGGL